MADGAHTHGGKIVITGSGVVTAFVIGYGLTHGRAIGHAAGQAATDLIWLAGAGIAAVLAGLIFIGLMARRQTGPRYYKAEVLPPRAAVRPPPPRVVAQPGYGQLDGRPVQVFVLGDDQAQKLLASLGHRDQPVLDELTRRALDGHEHVYRPARIVEDGDE
jgi:hypothetical protein